MQLSEPCAQPKKQDIFNQQTRNGIHTASSWLLGKFGQKREAAWECAGGYNLCWSRGGRTQPSPADKTHFPFAGSWRRGARDQPGPTRALTPIWHISVLIHLTVQVWPGAAGSAAAKRLVMLRLPSWRGLGAHGGLLTCALQPSGAAQLCPSYGLKRWNLIEEISRAGAGITFSPRQQGLLGAMGCLLDKFNPYRTLQHQRGPEEAARCCVLGQPQHREKSTSTEALASDSGAGKIWQHQDGPGCWLTMDVDAL